MLIRLYRLAALLMIPEQEHARVIVVNSRWTCTRHPQIWQQWKNKAAGRPRPTTAMPADPAVCLLLPIFRVCTCASREVNDISRTSEVAQAWLVHQPDVLVLNSDRFLRQNSLSAGETLLLARTHR